MTMGITRTATLWYGVAEKIQDPRRVPFALKHPLGSTKGQDELARIFERIHRHGLILVRFGNGVCGVTYYGLCEDGHSFQVEDYTDQNYARVQIPKLHMDREEWRKKLVDVKWSGIKARSWHLGLWTW